MLNRLITVSLIALTAATAANASEQSVQKELSFLKDKVTKLEQKIATTNTQGTQTQAAPTSILNSDALKVGGEIRADFASFSRNKASNDDNGVAMSRARLKASGTIDTDWNYKIETDFATDPVSIKKAYFEYNGLDLMKVKIGRDFIPFGLDRELKFPEDPLSSNLGPTTDDALVLSSKTGKNWQITAGGGTGDAVKKSGADSKKFGVFGRASYAPIYQNDNVLHFGGSIAHLRPRGTQLSYEASPDTALAKAAVQTREARADGKLGIPSVKHVNTYEADVAVIRGPFSVQGEYITAKVRTTSGNPNYTFDGGYGQVAYTLTGESIRYDAANGSFDTPLPKKPFSLKNGTWGAWEFAARYSVIDLNSGARKDGKMSTTSLGLNWFINKNIYTMFSYSIVKTDSNAVFAKNNPRIFMVRTSVSF